MNPHPALRRTALLVATFALLASAGAQTTAERDDTVRLAPFTVSTEKDTGYIAADVLTSGMLTTNLLRSPSDVTVLTRDFLDDIVAIDSIQAQLWLTSTEVIGPAQSTNPTDFGTAATFRGVPGSTANTRNYWKNGFTPEAYIIDRLEGARGPNGILYGDAVQGGKLNTVTKRPTFSRDFATAKLLLSLYSTQSEMGRGLYLDFNHRFSDKLAVRLNLQHKVGPQYYDRSKDNHRGANVTATYRPWRGGALTVEVEKDLIVGTSYRPDAYFDTQSLWDRVTTVSSNTQQTSGNTFPGQNGVASGINRLGNHTWVYVAGVGTMDWINEGRTTGTGISTLPGSRAGGRDLLPNFPVKPSRTFNMQSSLEQMQNHTANYNVSFSQEFGHGLVVEVAADHNNHVAEGDTLYFTNAYIDVNRKLPDGQANPNFGKVFSESTGGWNPVRTADYYTGARAAVAMPVKWRMYGHEFSQSFSLMATWREAVHAFKAWQYYRDNGAIAPNGATSASTDSNQIVKIWRYWDDPSAAVVLPTSDANNKYRWIMSRDQHNSEHLYSVLAGTVGSYWDDRVLLVLGVRHDRFHAAGRDIQRRDPVTGDPTFMGPSNPTVPFRDTDVNTPQIGLTFFPVKQIGLYANRSNGFNPSIQNIPKLDGSGPYNLAVSRGRSAGLRFNLFDGKLVGSAGYYDSFEAGAPSNQGLSQLNNIWNAVANAGGPTDHNIIQTGGLAQYSDSLTRRQWGWEIEAVANLTRGLRIIANVALPHTKQMNSLPDTKAYYAANIGLWTQYRSVAAVNTALNNLENALSGTADGRPINGLYRYRGNVFATYEFQKGAMRGLSVGAGANFFGQQIIGNITGNPFSFLYADPYEIVTMTLGYKFKAGKFPVSMNLAVSNLLNYQEPIFRQGGVSVYQGKYYFSQYYWPTPPEARLTATVRF